MFDDHIVLTRDGESLLVTDFHSGDMFALGPVGLKMLKFHQLIANPRSLTFSPDESNVYFCSCLAKGFFEMDTAMTRCSWSRSRRTASSSRSARPGRARPPKRVAFVPTVPGK